MSHDNDNDCITRAITAFNNVGLRFRFGVIVFSALLSFAALLTLVITQSTATASGFHHIYFFSVVLANDITICKIGVTEDYRAPLTRDEPLFDYIQMSRNAGTCRLVQLATAVRPISRSRQHGVVADNVRSSRDVEGHVYWILPMQTKAVADELEKQLLFVCGSALAPNWDSLVGLPTSPAPTEWFYPVHPNLDELKACASVDASAPGSTAVP
jgi:hypothetical protein